MLVAKDKIPKSEYRQEECLPKNKLDRPYNNWVAPGLPKHPVLALCETETDIDYFAQPSAPKIDKIIALTPQAAAYCCLTDTPYLKIEDFFDVRAFWHGDEPMVALQGHWAESIDAFLEDVYPPFREAGFQPAGASFFFLKIMADMLFRAVFGLSHLFVTIHPKHVYYFSTQTADDAIDETLLFKDSVYRRLLPLSAEVYDVSIEQLPLFRGKRDIWQPKKAAPRKTLIGRLLSVLPPELINHLRQAKHLGFAGLFKANRAADDPILLYSNSFEVDMVVRCARKMGFRAKTFDEILPPGNGYDQETSDLTASLEKAWEHICQSHIFREPLRWCGVDMFNIAESRFKYWWHTLIPHLWGMFQHACIRFRQEPPNVVMAYSPWSSQHHALFQAARLFKIPTLTYQHGGFEGNCEYTIYDMTDLRQSDYRLVYGEGNAAYLQERKEQSAVACAKIIPVGSARLDALRETLEMESDRSYVRQKLNVEESETLILYLPTSYQYNWYMSRQAYLGVSYIELHAQVINVLREFSQLRFVYKPFPEQPLDPICQIIEASCPNCKVVLDMPVERLLQGSDAFILDIPSTGLLEALLTAKPILVFSDQRFIALRSEARTLLNKRVTLCETPDDFIDQLRLFLRRGDFEKLEYADREFLRAYGTFKDDGNSVHHAFEALDQIAKVLPKK
jgi:hypothetical protein